MGKKQLFRQVRQKSIQVNVFALMVLKLNLVPIIHHLISSFIGSRLMFHPKIKNLNPTEKQEMATLLFIMLHCQIIYLVEALEYIDLYFYCFNKKNIYRMEE